MPSDYFLTIKTKQHGVIKGEAQAHGFEEDIQVDKFTIGLHSPSSFDPNTGQHDPTARIHMDIAEFEIPTSTASPQLFHALCTNATITTAVLKCKKHGSGLDKNGKDLKPKEMIYLQWTFSDARIVMYKQGGGDNGTSDTFHLAYPAVEILYKQQNSDGSLGADISHGYDTGENKTL